MTITYLVSAVSLSYEKTKCTMVIAHFVFIINGISLYSLLYLSNYCESTEFVTCWSKDLGKQWNTSFAFLAILLLSTIPNIGLAILITLKPPTYSTWPLL